jgi:hypothetical protein
VGEVGFDEAVDIVEGILDLLGECAGQCAITAASESAGGDDRVAEFIFQRSDRLDFIKYGLGELGGLFGVFAGDDAGFGGQALGDPGLVGIQSSYICHRPVALTAVGPARSFLERELIEVISIGS